MKAGITGLLLACAVLLAPTSPALALTPSPSPSDILFSNGGRILSMKADGSDRKVLFGRKVSPKNVWPGATEPVVSPDGSTVAFSFRRTVGSKDVTDVWTMNSDGTGARRLIKSRPNRSFGDPVFMPDGRLAVAYFIRGESITRTGVRSMTFEGKSPKTVFELKRRNRPYVLPPTVAEPDFSRDGRKLLYVVSNGAWGDFDDQGFENPLMVRNLETGKTTKVAESVFDATWSPDGKRIAYSGASEDSGLEICWWEFGCDFESQLAVIDADGSGKRLLTGKPVDERNPDWSRWNTIVFQSARNLPGAGESNEIYSVRANGKCLTMLTNGSPASTNPVFSEAEGLDSRPAGCGADPPDSGVEVEVPDRARSNQNLIWLGERPGVRVMSGAMAETSGSFFLYFDCDRQLAADCRKPVGLFTSDICRYRGSIAQVFSEGPMLRRQRGLPLYASYGAEIGPFTTLLAGRNLLYFFGGSGRGKNLGKVEVDQLRLMGEESPQGDLPAVKFPSFDIRLMKKVASTYKATGSVPRTARRTGLSGKRVRDNLKFSRAIKEYGDYGTVSCPRS